MEVHPLHATAGLTLSAVSCCTKFADRGPTEIVPYDSLVLVRRGAFRIHAGLQAQIADPLTLLSFPAGSEYSVSHPAGCGDDCIEIGFREPQLANRTGVAVHRAEPETLRSFRGLLQAAQAGDLEDLHLEEVSAVILGAIVEAPAGGAARTPRRRRARAAAGRQVDRVRLLLLAEPARRWSLAEIARAAGASPYHLTRLFRARTGMPLHRFLVRLRLAIALDRILDGEPGLAGLAHELGFASHSHFTSVFRRAYGIPPRAAARLATHRRPPQSFRARF